MHLIAKIRSVIFYLGYSGSLIIYASLCFLIAWSLPIHKRYTLFIQWNRFVIWWLNISCGMQYRISGLDSLPPSPYVLVSNHQSPWETIFLYYKFSPLCATLKKELLNIPFFGWSLRLLKPIAIDRSKRREARSTLLDQGRDRLSNNISVLIFPEGTRVDPGQEKKYSSGAAELAIAAGCLIVPLVHNAGLFWPAHKLIKHKGVVDVVIGQAIETKDREPKDLMREIQEWSKEALSKIS